MSDSEGCLFYSIELEGLKTATYSVITEVYDAQERLVAQAKGLTGEIRVTNPNLWWPRGMNKSVGYLYTLKVENFSFPKNYLFLNPYFLHPPSKIQLWNDAKNVEGDVYRLPFGIRFIEWNSTGVFINGKSLYFKGFGRHEDAIVNLNLY